MIRLLLLSTLLVLCGSVQAQIKTYQLFDARGKKVKYKKFIKALKKQDIILFGEYHNDPIAHWLQLKVTKELHDAEQPLTLGFEMLETDLQLLVTAYLTNALSKKELAAQADLWSNYETDYAPIVDYAKDNYLAVISTNIPRRFARQVYRQGLASLDSLSDADKALLMPLPMAFDGSLSQYQEMEAMMGSGHEGGSDIVKAQAVKDATMAHFILKNYRPGSRFLHFNGSFHSDFHQGILWYLQQENDSLNYATITTVLQEDLTSLAKEHLNRADFIVVVDADVPRSY